MGHPDMWKSPCKWTHGTFESTQTMSKMAFSGKERFLEAHDAFMTSRDKYVKTGDPWTFSALLYGTPGCGKTSLIKALVNRIREKYGKTMHVVVIPLSEVTSSADFEAAVLSPKLRDYTIPYENRIIVFEDFDACDAASIFAKRDLRSNEEKSSNAKHKNAGASDKEDEEKEGVLTLSSILNVLDGLRERTGQQIFWTTNVENPRERFDPAFLRPGRMDVTVRFSHCTTADIAYLLRLYYENAKFSEKDLEEIPKGEWTPARVKQVMKSSPTIEIAIRRLCEGVAATEINGS